MGFGIGAVQLNLDLWNSKLFEGIKSVVDMGSQELHLKVEDFEELLQKYGVPNYRRADFPNAENWPGRPLCSVEPFYRLLGVEKYNCIDLNQAHGALPIDLNKPLDPSWANQQFDMVTDHGTNEHVFNAAEAFKTMHSLCNPGGFIQVIQILYPFDIYHGFYRFDPFLYRSLASANNYKIIYSSYVVATLTTTRHGSQQMFHLPLDNELLRIIKMDKLLQLSVCFMLQKLENAEFCYPSQLME